MAILYLFLIFLGALILQVSALGDLRILGALPDLLLVLFIIVSVYEDRVRVIFFAIFFGFIMDIVTKDFFGFSLLFFALTAFIVQYFTKSKGGTVPLPVIVVLLFFLSLFKVVFNYIVFARDGGVFEIKLLLIYGIQIGLNIFLGIILFYALDRFFRFLNKFERRRKHEMI